MQKIVREIIPYVFILIFVVLIRSYIITPVEVTGESMESTLYDGEILLLDKVSYKLSDIKRFDVIVIDEINEKLIKRVIGLPGDSVYYEDNVLYINGKEVLDDYAKSITKDFTLYDICKCNEIPEDKYLVLGDNRAISADSRVIGLIDKSDIEGKTILRIWPLNKLGTID